MKLLLLHFQQIYGAFIFVLYVDNNMYQEISESLTNYESCNIDCVYEIKYYFLEDLIY